MTCAKPEMELLAACARTVVEADARPHIAALAAQVLDWDRLRGTAQDHGLVPLLHRTLSGVCPDAVPAAALERMAADCRANAAHSLRLTAELLRLLDLLDEHRIPAVPFKGPTLAALAYGNIALRQFGDLDILIDPPDFARARALLRGQGYRCAFDLTPAQERAQVRRARQLPMVRGEGDGALTVELHTGLLGKTFPARIDREALRRRLRAVPLLGRQVPTFCPEDMVVLLCMHGGKHRWSCLGWLSDVAELLRTTPCLHWDEITARAAAAHALRALHLGLLLARRLLQAPVPAHVQDAMNADSRAVRLAERMAESFLAGEKRGKIPADSLRYALRLRERLRDGIGHCWQATAFPTVADWSHCRLPHGLSFLYYGVRPWRMIRKHAVAPVGRLLAALVRPGHRTAQRR
ncbi:MAG: nucleotidyltransferase family protein [Candidatus Brocadiaceae bacterium]|nr:nucleotidyltransferase family protein [Candidatus Brocadiaceae bacterium]